MKKIGLIIAGFSVCFMFNSAVYAKNTQPKAAQQTQADKAEDKEAIELFSKLCGAVGRAGMKLRQAGLSQKEAQKLMEETITDSSGSNISHMIQTLIEAAIENAYSEPVEKTKKAKQKAMNDAEELFKTLCIDLANEKE